MNNKAIKAFLIGYYGDEKYRLWVQESNTVICSRDVRFNEKIDTCGKVVHFPITVENRMTSVSEDQRKLKEKTEKFLEMNRKRSIQVLIQAMNQISES
ncbi:hypothetical protein AVEN_258212-1 [Araneus ventricosus]|uniref:Retroviral polymerase SH3-like domain-containing protein n=1 Tax=Araneus ventricosus TaxID=182803 RepID=A0A4Y2MQS9_ARAVE|nr:hypothetical protein AVEN_258212-1 [Araneus ventricosus]